jgi:hypothetical protein
MFNENKILFREVTNEDIQSVQGWTCPICKISLSPKIKVCPKCEKNIIEAKESNKQILNG